MWLIAGSAAAVGLVLSIPILSELQNKALPFVILNPFLLLPPGIFALVRAFMAIGPWLDYRAATTDEQRRARVAIALGSQKSAPLVIYGALGLVASVVLIVIFTMYEPGEVSLAGRFLQVELVTLTLFVTTLCFGLLLRKLVHR
jgi:hypothetical protein